MLEYLASVRARMRADEAGQTAVEYAVALVLFAAVLAVSLAVLVGALASTDASSPRSSSPAGAQPVEIPLIPVACGSEAAVTARRGASARAATQAPCSTAGKLVPTRAAGRRTGNWTDVHG